MTLGIGPAIVGQWSRRVPNSADFLYKEKGVIFKFKEKQTGKSKRQDMKYEVAG